MTGHLDQVSNNVRASNELSGDNKPDLQHILIEEAYKYQASKIETSQFEIQTQI